MKILLLGDFSSAHYNLKLGLQELGHQVTLVSHRDGFKKTPTDIEFYHRSENGNKYLGAAREILSQYLLSTQLKGYDVVQTASHIFYHNRIDNYLFPKIFENNGKSVLFNGACSEPYNQFVKTLSYSPCATCKQFDLDKNGCENEKINARAHEYSRYERYHAIVSSHFEYYKAFERTVFHNKNHFIPIPIRSEELSLPISVVPEKLNVYYGETRKGFKGGAVIEAAIEMVKSSTYGRFFNFTTSRKIPYDEYVRVMNETHVLIDQANSYSYGVNALVAMSKGKIVLSGAEPAAVEFMGIEQSECPVVNIRPSEKDIYDKLIALYESRFALPEHSQQSIDFVKLHHDPIAIAHRYVELYNSL